MDQVLQMVASSKMMFFVDGFSGYNQIEVVEEDQQKIAFMMLWGTFAYKRMPFGLINVGAIFQRAMNSTFATYWIDASQCT